MATALLATGTVAYAASAVAGASRAHRRSTIPASTLKSLEAAVKKAEGAPAWKAPGPPVRAASLRGDKILAMPVSSQIGACETQAEDFAALGKQLGIQVTVFHNSGGPPAWESGINDALAAHDNAIALFCGIIPGAIAPQLAAAKKAGVPVVDGNYNETGNYAGLSAETGVNTVQGMHESVNLALANLHGAPLHALVLTSSSIIQSNAGVKAVQDQVKKDCPKLCSVVETIDIPIQDVPTKSEPEVASALVAHPNINAVIAVFGTLAVYAWPALEHSNNPNLHIYLWGGSRALTKQMEHKPYYVYSDSAPSIAWDAYAEMDQVIRLLTHKAPAPVKKETLPNRLWVPSDASAYVGPNNTYSDVGYSHAAFINDYRKLWGLSPISTH